ncbi:exportin-5 [Neodiprion virginianus]|uniref:exportin-5 n=1 Tax=Neodiprion virginianus TaxID=2961670 RepID=UPI001EE6F975|nr:exportin-5 [Neodiprion virginianus]XP_046625234.1 exportin-5 [Neodiprion virginianus]XP_046625235.1 exportin-5 [Neodiprion virginianus]XP_046625236.1 exportin-5 [Neodiprion virginianus]XP_046625238.1 exportin-5 [Neodiprion virginianus]
MDAGVGDVAQISAELAQVVEVMMSPGIPHEQRLEAYAACERFKESSPLCAQCGLFLAQKYVNSSSVVRHFGLQLMEHCVKYRWTQMSQPEKLFIKENAMKLLQDGTEPFMQEETHIKDALSRVIVEMIKREWPQQWPTLLAELSHACTRGESQTELVLLVFLRLVEDVALLQTLESNQRRKDIYQALTTNMAEIFTFFLRLIEQHFTKFQEANSLGHVNEATAHGKVVQVVLLTLTGFVEWVSIAHVMAEDGRLLQILCVLLGNPTFQCPAAECLLQIVNRKGKAEDRKQLMILYSEEALRCIYSAATMPAPPSGPNNSEENYYLFLKKLIQILTGMATQLCILWGKEDGSTVRPAHFNLYLDAVMTFTTHSSLTLSHMANAIWIMLFKHDQIKADPLLLTYVPKFVECTAPKLIKVSYTNGRPTNGTCSISDYDSEEEFNVFFHRLRMDLLEGFRHATMVAPLVTFAYVQQWLSAKITKGLTDLGYKSNLNDPVYLEWEALAQALDSVSSRILHVNERPSVQTGLQLLELCLSYSPLDPWLLSALLSCVSGLFVFLSMSTGSMEMPGVTILPRVLEKIFAALVFEGQGETKDNRSRAVKNVRRHAASLMVKIGLKYPLLLLPVFEQIHTTVLGLVQEPSQLTKMESVTLYEALLLISNHFCDYERQTRFVAEVINQGQSQFVTLGVEAFKGPIEFIRFVGLNCDPVENNLGERTLKNRADLVFCIATILSIVKRCSVPEDPDRAARGGFLAALSESGNPVYRNPASPHVIPLLPTLFALIRAMNALFTSEALAVLSEGYRSAHGLLESEKSNLLGLNSSSNDNNLADSDQTTIAPVVKMQTFLTNIHDNCYHMLGSGCHTIGRDFYQLSGLAPALLNSVFSNMEVIPDYRLRPIIRVFMKPFIYSCPPAYYETVLIPVLAHVATHMCQRLTAKWKYMTQLYESGGLDEENCTNVQEVIDDMLNRNLTRDFVDVLKVALVGGAASDASPPDLMEQDTDGMAIDTPSTRGSSIVAEVVSELGTLLLRHPSTCHSVVLCVLGALSWNDSNASLKATLLTGPIVRALAVDGSLTPAMAAHVMVAVLQGLQLHGQHEANQGSLITLGAQIYECLRPKFPNIIEVMQQIPGVNPADLQRFDEKMTVISTKGNKVEKGKKDLFKKITNHLIGRSMGQLFRKEVKIDNLPRLDVPGKPRPLRVDDISKGPSETGLTALFASPT